MEGGPFRQRAKFLLCPRCGEVLDRAFDAVQVCLRCEGMWIAPVSLEKAFGDARWPYARSMWWRDSLQCPECAFEGATHAMTAALAGTVYIDRCASHGVWLDRGELGRLMGGDIANEEGDDDLAVLRELVRAHEADLGALIQRREQWRASTEAKAENARARREQLRAELEAERRAREEQERRDREEQERDLVARAQAADVRRKQADEQYAAELRRQRERARRRSELAEQRRNATSEVAHCETRVAEARAELAALESELAGKRARLRAIQLELGELED